jgi:DNA-binding transcriptional LysR family regulator
VRIAAVPGGHGRPGHPRELAQHLCLYLAEHAGDKRWQLRRGNEQLSVTVKAAMPPITASCACKACWPIWALPPATLYRAGGAGAGQIETVLDDWEFTTAYRGMAWLLYPPNRYLPPKVRVLIDYLADCLADQTTPMTR